MMSRIMPAIATLLDTAGFSGTKRDVAKAVFCDPKTAARVLMDLYIHRNVYIVSWVRERGGPLPIYAKRTDGQEDAPKPVAKQQLPFKQRGVEHIYARRRERAQLNKTLSGEPRLGLWGL